MARDDRWGNDNTVAETDSESSQVVSSASGIGFWLCLRLGGFVKYQEADVTNLMIADRSRLLLFL